ncbi:hypothetical protein Tco_0003926 [Tanacetum coccineum]
MLEIKGVEIGGNEEVFTSEAWRRAFDIREPIYTGLCHEFFSTYEFDEEVTDEELTTKKLIKFKLGGRGHSLRLLELAHRLVRISCVYLGVLLRPLGVLEPTKFVMKLAKKMQLLTDDVLDGLSASIHCRSLDATTLRELIGPNVSHPQTGPRRNTCPRA